MGDLFQRLVNLLGTPIDNPAFQKLLKDCGEKPDIIETDLMQDFAFWKLGLHIDCDKKQNQIRSLFFHLRTVAVLAREIQPFAQTLPFGVLPNDNRDKVKEKLGVKRKAEKIEGRTPGAPKDFWDSYEIPPLKYTFIFNGGDKRLSSMSVDYFCYPSEVKFMENCFERIVELLGKTPEDPHFAQFIHDLKDTPQVYLDNDISIEYAFNQSGFFLSYYKGCKSFANVFFHSLSKKNYSKDHGDFIQYRGNFPSGIEFGDTSDEVRLKLDCKPLSAGPFSSRWTEEYKLNDLLIRFSFSESTKLLTNVQLRYAPAWDLDKGEPKNLRSRETL